MIGVVAMRVGLLKLSIAMLLVSSLSLATIQGWTAPTFTEAGKPGLAGAGGWHYYTVDTIGQVGPFNSLAVDKYGIPHISYFDATNSDLKYATWTGSNWRVETVDSDGYVGTDTSIAVDSQGYPHISYRAINSSTNWNDLKYASWTGSSWKIETLETAYSTAFYTSLVIDKDDRPHISFYEGWSGYRIRYATSNGSGWSIDTVDYVSGTITRTSLALDSLGHPHVAYYDGVPDYTLKHSWWDGTEWRNETLSGTRYVCGYASLALDVSDTTHMAYQNLMNNNIRYASHVSGGWNTTTVDSAGDACTFASLALDGAGRAHVAYSETIHHSLRYAEEATGGWNPETVNDTGFVSSHISLALNVNGTPRISYYDETGQDLLYAAKDELGPGQVPTLSFSPPLLDFGNLQQGSTSTMTFDVWNSGGGTLNYSLYENLSWITAVSPANGSSTGNVDAVNISIDTTGVPVGLHSGSVEIASNGGNGTVAVTVNVTAPPRQVTLRIEPRTLNLKSKGNWITAHLTVEKGSARDINASTLLLNGVVPPAWWKVTSNDTLLVKFDRAAVQAILAVSDSVDIEVAGYFYDGGSFEAHDVIRVINP
jgi:hypothetical protein